MKILPVDEPQDKNISPGCEAKRLRLIFFAPRANPKAIFSSLDRGNMK